MNENKDLFCPLTLIGLSSKHDTKEPFLINCLGSECMLWDSGFEPGTCGIKIALHFWASSNMMDNQDFKEITKLCKTINERKDNFSYR